MNYAKALTGGSSEKKISPVHNVPEKTEEVDVHVAEDEDIIADKIDGDAAEEDNEEGSGSVVVPHPITAISPRVANRKYTGRFAPLEFETPDAEDDFWKLFAVTAGPGGLCSFALTCTFFFDKLLTQEIWDLVSPQLPAVIHPTIRFLIDISPVDDDSAEEKVQTVPVTSIRNEYQKLQLVKYWLRILAKAEDEREKLKEKDILASQQPWNAVLKGGFSIETGNKKNQQTIFALQDLSLVSSMVVAIVELLTKTSKSVQIPYLNGNIILSLYGRAGPSLSFHYKAGKESVKSIFPLDEFSEGIRKAAEDYVPLAGSCRVQLQKLRKTIPESEVHLFADKEKWIEKVLAHDKVNLGISTIYNKLAAGVIPGSLLPEIFSQKQQDKHKKNVQAEMENENIFEIILENLPPTWEEAKKAAIRLANNANEQRDNEKKEREAKNLALQLDKERIKAEQFELKKKMKDAEKEGKTVKQVEAEIKAAEANAKKKKTKTVKTTDEDGFVKIEVVDAQSGNAVAKVDAQTPEAPKVKKIRPVVIEKSEKSSAVANPYVFALEENKVISPADEQMRKQNAKAEGIAQAKAAKKKTDSAEGIKQDKSEAKKDKASKLEKTVSKLEKTASKLEKTASKLEKSEKKDKPVKEDKEKPKKSVSEKPAPTNKKDKSVKEDNGAKPKDRRTEQGRKVATASKPFFEDPSFIIAVVLGGIVIVVSYYYLFPV